MLRVHTLEPWATTLYFGGIALVTALGMWLALWIRDRRKR